MDINKIFNSDCITGMRSLPDGCIQTCITSPPYFGLRDYGVDGQIGLEQTPEQYVERLVTVFREVRRVLRHDGTLWLNLGDSYASGGGKAQPHRDSCGGGFVKPNTAVNGLKSKDLIGIPWRVAFALQSDGWYLRSDIIWEKPNAMPESVRDRPTKSHEYLFLLTKSEKYYYDSDAIKEPAVRPGERQTFGGQKGRDYQPSETDPNFRNGNEQWGRTITTPDKRNKRTVWHIPTKPFPGAHFAVFPPDLIKPCILAGTSLKVCPICGQSWKRVIEKTGHINNREDCHVPNNSPTKTDSTGWAPTTRPTDEFTPMCNCLNNDGSDKSVALDPFMGAGTTALVAKQLNRSYIGYELNPEYVQLARDRLA